MNYWIFNGLFKSALRKYIVRYVCAFIGIHVEMNIVQLLSIRNLLQIDLVPLSMQWVIHIIVDL